MNIVKRNKIIKQAIEEINKRAELAIREVYMKGYHNGRIDLRDKYKNLLIIKPECVELLKRKTENPCIGCSNSYNIKIGCIADPTLCVAKQD